MKRVPTIVITLPADYVQSGGVKELRFPMEYVNDAVYSGDQGSQAGWIPDYSAMLDNPVLKTLMWCASEWAIDIIPEYLHSAIHEGGERKGEYEVYESGKCEEDGPPLFTLKWKVEGDLDQVDE
jgi:hypothetical protein